MAGGIKGRTTAETMHDMVTKREVRLSGRGRRAEK